MDDLGLHALRLQGPRDLGKGYKSVSLATGASVYQQYFHGIKSFRKDIFFQLYTAHSAPENSARPRRGKAPQTPPTGSTAPASRLTAHDSQLMPHDFRPSDHGFQKTAVPGQTRRTAPATGNTDTKKRGFFRISFTLMPDKNYLLQHSSSAFSAQSLVESHFSAQQASVESHFSVHSVQAAASVVAAAAAASPSAAFLFELPQQLTIATAAITTTKEKIFFITSNV